MFAELLVYSRAQYLDKSNIVKSCLRHLQVIILFTWTLLIYLSPPSGFPNMCSHTILIFGPVHKSNQHRTFYYHSHQITSHHPAPHIHIIPSPHHALDSTTNENHQMCKLTIHRCICSHTEERSHDLCPNNHTGDARNCVHGPETSVTKVKHVCRACAERGKWWEFMEGRIAYF